MLKCISKIKQEIQDLNEKKKEEAEAKMENDEYELIKKKQDLEDMGLNKGTQYIDIVTSTKKEKKELKLDLQKYELIKTEENILVQF